VLVTVIALGVVFFAARGAKSHDRVSASGPVASASAVTSTSLVSTTAPVRVIELAAPAPTPPASPAPTAAPATPGPTTTVKPKPTTTTVKPKPTTTLKPKPTTTVTTLPPTTVLDTAAPATAPPSSALVDPGQTTVEVRMQEGRGTFHRYDNTDPQWGDRPCAHRTLPKGTVVTVVNTATGASTWCIVKDRGPYGNAIIDLDEEQFAEIAPVAAGVINVRITW
jgi:hypothetical protein